MHHLVKAILPLVLIVFCGRTTFMEGSCAVPTWSTLPQSLIKEIKKAHTAHQDQLVKHHRKMLEYACDRLNNLTAQWCGEWYVAKEGHLRSTTGMLWRAYPMLQLPSGAQEKGDLLEERWGLLQVLLGDESVPWYITPILFFTPLASVESEHPSSVEVEIDRYLEVFDNVCHYLVPQQIKEVHPTQHMLYRATQKDPWGKIATMTTALCGMVQVGKIQHKVYSTPNRLAQQSPAQESIWGRMLRFASPYYAQYAAQIIEKNIFTHAWKNNNLFSSHPLLSTYLPSSISSNTHRGTVVWSNFTPFVLEGGIYGPISSKDMRPTWYCVKREGRKGEHLFWMGQLPSARAYQAYVMQILLYVFLSLYNTHDRKDALVFLQCIARKAALDPQFIDHEEILPSFLYLEPSHIQWSTHSSFENIMAAVGPYKSYLEEHIWGIIKQYVK